jgi:AcrR family transcriptional regulator
MAPAPDTAVTPTRRMPARRRRAVILESARHLFAQRGYHGVSVGDLARGAGCSEPILYRHFPSKQALFAAVLEQGSQELLDSIEDALTGSEDDPFPALARHARRATADARTAELVRIRSLAVALADEPEIRDALARAMDAYLETLTRAARRSQEGGSVPRGVDPRHLAELWAGLGFLAGFIHAVGGERAIRGLAPTADTLLALATAGRDGGVDPPARPG